ncbi:hypothetical protein HN873_058801 [Arachis hypogaea]
MDMVNKINPEKEVWNLKVGVIRLWTVPTFTGQLLPNSMEMILVDESVELDFRMLCLHQSLDLILTSQSSIPHGVSASQPIGIVGSRKNVGIEEDFMKLTPRLELLLY